MIAHRTRFFLLALVSVMMLMPIANSEAFRGKGSNASKSFEERLSAVESRLDEIKPRRNQPRVNSNNGLFGTVAGDDDAFRENPGKTALTNVDDASTPLVNQKSPKTKKSVAFKCAAAGGAGVVFAGAPWLSVELVQLMNPESDLFNNENVQILAGALSATAGGLAGMKCGYQLLKYHFNS